MNRFKYLTIIFLGVLLISCGSNSGHKKSDFTIKTNAIKGNISNSATLQLSLENKKNHTIDSILYRLNGNIINEASALNNFKLGKQTIEATIYYDGEKQTTSSTVTILNSELPKVYTYKIINEYPHDITSYTQGLEFHNDTLFESTGQLKESKLRKLDYKTGTVLKDLKLADEYFGEGLTILNNKVYQLTWQKGTGFVYDVNTFKKISMDLFEGEILGLSGLLGSGANELLRCIFGIIKQDNGQLSLNDKVVTINEPRDAIVNGIGYIPSDRKNEGLIQNNSIKDNKSVILFTSDVIVTLFFGLEFFSSLKDNSGLIEIENEEITNIYNKNNSSIAPFIPERYLTSTSKYDDNGALWIDTGRVQSPLSKFENNQWTSYDFSSIITNPMTDENGFSEIVIGPDGTKWIGGYKKGVRTSTLCRYDSSENISKS